MNQNIKTESLPIIGGHLPVVGKIELRTRKII